MIRLLTLGGLDVRRGSGEGGERLLGPGKRAAVLTYLAVARQNGPLSRDTLLGLFWPEADDRHARDALSQLLRRLRDLLGEDAFLDTPRSGVALDPTFVWCDAVELESALARQDHARALALYRGDFLQGAHLSGAPDFEDWVAGRRDWFRERAATAAVRLAEVEERRGNVAEAIRAVEHALRLAPFDEGRVRMLMRLHLATDDHGRAAEAFDRFAGRLASELDAKPAAETVALLQSARARVVVRDDAPVVTLEREGRSTAVSAGASAARRPGWVFAAAAAVAVGLVVVGSMLARGPAGEALPLEKERILVDLFENRTGDPALDAMGRRATDHVTAGLTYTTFADVVTQGSSLLSRRGEPVPAGLADPLAVARARRAGTLVRGSYVLEGDGLRFEAQLVDVATGTVIAAPPPVTTTPSRSTEGLEALRDRVMAAIAAHVDPRLEEWSRFSSRPPTLAVYRTFAEGIEAHTTLKIPGGPSGGAAVALPLFLEAFEADPDFTMAAIWGVWAAMNVGNDAVRDSLTALLLARRTSLTGIDRYIVDAMAADTPDERLASWRRVVDVAPGSGYLKHAALEADRAGELEEALRYRRAADPASGWLYGWVPFFYRYGGNLHALGRCEEMLAVAEQARRSLPPITAERAAERIELEAFACLGDVPRLMAVAERFLLREEAERAYREREGTALGLCWAALELLAHAPPGTDVSPFVDLAERYMEENLEGEPGVASELSHVLRATGRLEEARDVRASAGLEPDPYVEAGLLLREGRREELEALIAGAGAYTGPAYTGPALEAAVAAQWGDMERAMKAAIEARQLWGLWGAGLHVWPIFRPLVDHPPFREMVGLP